MTEKKRKNVSKEKETSPTTTTTTTTNTVNIKSSGSKMDITTTSNELNNNNNNSNQSINFISLKYPIFCCSSNQKNIVAVGGGGGKSKTGIPNSINLFQWNNDTTSNFKQLENLDTLDSISNLTWQFKKEIFSYSIDSKVYIVEYTPNNNNKFKVLREIDVESPITTSDTENSGNKYEIQRIRFTKDSEKIIIVDSEKLIKIYSNESNNSNNKCLKTIISGHNDEINDIDIHGTSTYLVSTSKDKSCKIINLLSGKVEHTLNYKHKQIPLGFRGCRFSPDNVYLYTCQSTPRSKSFQGCAVISKWEFLNGTIKEIQSREFHSAHNTTFDISPDGKYIAVATADSIITVLETDHLKTVDKYEPHGFIITDLSFSPDSTSVFSVSADYTCKSHKIGESSFNKKSKSIGTILILLSLIILILSYQFYFQKNNNDNNN